MYQISLSQMPQSLKIKLDQKEPFVRIDRTRLLDNLYADQHSMIVACKYFNANCWLEKKSFNEENLQKLKIC